MKTKVRVTLTCDTEVELEVDHDPNEDPTDLTKEDSRRARDAAGVSSLWDITDVEVVRG